MGICYQSEATSQARLKQVTEPIPSEIIRLELDTSNKRKEMGIKDNIPVPIDVTIKAMKSICKITIKLNGREYFATGFFMKISEAKKYLITNYHIISEDMVNKEIEIELYNQEKMKLNFNNRDVKYFPKPKDITMVEIKNNDSIYNDIEFLDYDYNYKKGYMIYEHADIFIIQHPLGKNASSSSGRIINIIDNEFDHNITTYKGSSGSPVILFTEKENSIQLIGIHKEGNRNKKLNTGTFIGEIFNNNTYINYIIAEIYINDEDINKKIRIIN